MSVKSSPGPSDPSGRTCHPATRDPNLRAAQQLTLRATWHPALEATWHPAPRAAPDPALKVAAAVTGLASGQ